MNTFNLRTRQELIGNELMDVCCDYPDQIRPIIDELVSHLNNNQLDQIEDLIVNNYGEEEVIDSQELEGDISTIKDSDYADKVDSYADKVDRLVDSMGSWLKCPYSEGIQSTSQVV